MAVRRYIFLTNDIGNVGGGNLYIAAKCKWLRQLGWQPEVYYYERRPVMLPDMQPFADNYVRALEFRFLLCSDAIRQQAARQILHLPPKPQSDKPSKPRSDKPSKPDFADKGDEIVIESFQYQMGYWGEWLASLCGGRHILYTLHENPPRMTPSALEFMRFKLRRSELYGITPSAIPLLLPEADGDATFIYAAGSGARAAAEYQHPALHNLTKVDITLLTVTRLEKPYVATMLREIRHWIESHPEWRFRYILMGDTPYSGVRRKMLRILTRRQPSNLDLRICGYTYPIPQQAYDVADIFVGCAGAARCAADSGVTTLVIDANDYQSIGIHPYETPTRLHRTTEPAVSVSSALQRIWSEMPRWRKIRAEHTVPAQPPIDFTPHLPLLEPATPEYYDLSQIVEPPGVTHLYRICRLLGGMPLVYATKKLKQLLK